MDNVDNTGQKSIQNLRKSRKGQKYGHARIGIKGENATKNPHWKIDKNQHHSVDNVDNLAAKNGFSDFYNVSGSHSYQQVAVHTFF